MKTFENPEFELIRFGNDVIATSAPAWANFYDLSDNNGVASATASYADDKLGY